MLGKICINLFFLSEKRLGESDASKVCPMTEDCFEQKNESMRGHGWCANFKMNQDRVCLSDLKYRVTGLVVLKKKHLGHVLCVIFLVNFYDVSKS